MARRFPRVSAIAAFVTALACLAFAPRAQAQILRIGFVDSQRIFEQYKDAQDAQERFSREINSWRTDADDRRRALDQLRNELKDQQLLSSDTRKLEKESELQKATSDYDKFVQDFWGPGGRVQRLNEEMTREVVGKIRDAVEIIANRDGYDLVLDAADGNVIFGVKSLDLTDRVLEELNKNITPTSGTPR